MERNDTKWYSLAGVWFGGIISVPTLLIGSQLIASMSFANAIIAGFVGFCFVVTYMSLVSIMAVDKRKSTVELTASSFGKKGANIIVGLIIGVSTIGWFGIQTSIAGASFSNLVKEMIDIDIHKSISAIFWGLVMVTTAVFGFKYLKWLNYIAVPAIILLLIYGVMVSFETYDFSKVTNYIPNAEEPLSLIRAIGFTIGFISVAGVIAPDYNRFAATRKDAVWGSIAGIIPSSILLLALGAIFAIMQGTYDIVAIFSKMGFPLSAMTILILATWTSNVINVYSAGLAFNNFLGLKESLRSKTTLVAGLVGIVLTVLGIMDNMLNFFTLLTVTITPVVGVLITDYFILKTYDKEADLNFNWKGIFGWAAGVVLMITMTYEIKYILGIVTSGVAYVIADMMIKQKSTN